MRTGAKRLSLVRGVLLEDELVATLEAIERELERAGRAVDDFYAELERDVERDRCELLAALELERYAL
jgi:hypothetical protein